MLRALLELIVTLLAVYVVRQVLAILARSFKGGFTGGGFPGAGGPGSAGTQGPAPPRAPSGGAVGELKKDPVCGTFISTQTEFQKSVRGEKFYFCSAECRDKFKG